MVMSDMMWEGTGYSLSTTVCKNNRPFEVLNLTSFHFHGLVLQVASREMELVNPRLCRARGKVIDYFASLERRTKAKLFILRSPDRLEIKKYEATFMFLRELLIRFKKNIAWLRPFRSFLPRPPLPDTAMSCSPRVARCHLPPKLSCCATGASPRNPDSTMCVHQMTPSLSSQNWSLHQPEIGWVWEKTRDTHFWYFRSTQSSCGLAICVARSSFCSRWNPKRPSS